MTEEQPGLKASFLTKRKQLESEELNVFFTVHHSISV
jgi:hypothetical protein